MLNIAITQLQTTSANPKINFERMKHFICKAINVKQDIIIFPEMCLPGYFNGDIWEQTSFLKECEFYHEQLRELSKNISIIFGSVGCDWEKKNEDGRVRKYNAAYCALNGKFIKNSKTNLNFWPKTLLANYREFDDSRHFYDLRKLAFEKNCSVQELYEPITVKLKNKKISIGLSICEDAWSENYSFSPVEIFSQYHKHDFFLNLSSSPFTLGKNKRREILFSQLAQKIQLPIFYVNCVGVQNIGKTIYGFDGGSAIYNADGTIQPAARAFEEGLYFTSALPTLSAEFPKNELDNTHVALEYITKQICHQWGINKVVVGVSGGIDSALSATLMTRILGKENVFLINMPSQFNSQLTISAAQQLAVNLDCAFASVSIEDSIKYSKKQFAAIEFQNSKQKVQITGFTFENIQARDRGARILAAISAALGAVFTCNANKTELTVGYGTLYGDIAGFLCPLADLWKHDVYAMAQFYNEVVFQKEIIPQTTINVVPSAELSADQNVLEGKGDPLIYSYHDFLFRSWVEHWERKTPEDGLQAYLENKIDNLIGCKQGLTKQLFPTKELFCADLERWWNLYQGLGAVKRMQAPPVIALTRRAFGFDHREHLGLALFTKKYCELK
ncbi:MAG: NAD(+) synthase [Bdellovibrionota bacterium]